MISVLIYIVLIILSFIFRTSKLLSVVILIFMWVLWGWNYDNGDYVAYKTLYENALFDVGYYEVGYKLLMQVAQINGLDFQQFQILISLIVILLWGRFAFLLSYTPALFLVCVSLFFFPLDYVLLRNTLAFSIVLQGFYCVFAKRKLALVKYFVFVLCASTIHSTSLFYLLFLIIFKKGFFKSHGILLAVIVFSILLILPLSSHILSFLSVFAEDRGEIYGSSYPIFVMYSFFQVINVFFIYLFYSCSVGNKIYVHEFRTLYMMNLLLLFLIVLYFVLPISIRIFRNVAFVNMLYLLNLNQRIHLKFVLKLLIILMPFFLVCEFIIPVWDYTMFSLINFNLLLK